MNWAEKLNEKQLEAVTCMDQHVRVVAGAGSGKTRVLTYRIAYLIEELGVRPWNILAFTFTNKVAAEMKERVSNLVNGDITRFLSIRTFHSFAAYFLRQEIKVLGFPTTFTIIDEEDQTKMIKDIAADMGYRRSDEIIKIAIGFIGARKLEEKYPADIKKHSYFVPNEAECIEIYTRYEEAKDKMYALDFDDLLLQANLILENYPEIRMKWQNKVDHILIDEFQDTNDTEFKLISLLKKPQATLYVVGDPDQTIYTWRGANQEIMLELNKRFLDIKTVILNENYRSTQSILDSANRLIDHNKMRLKKDLFTNNSGGDPIQVKGFMSNKEEARYIAKEILRLKASHKYNLRDITLLYRSNYLTVDFEHAFMENHIPYRIYGGQKFYQRMEVKDVLAFFHLVINVKDDLSYERVINIPRRGIGETSIANLKAAAKEQGYSLYEFVSNTKLDDSPIKKSGFSSLKSLNARIDMCRIDVKKNEEVFSKILEDMISDIGYYDHLLKMDDGDDRIENVKALFEDLRHYLKANPEATFEQYLQDIALLSAQDDIIDGDFVTLMTVHTAKGLEFPVVFLLRFNEGIFPNMRAVTESGYKGMEEERRLAYVAITRAKEKLNITYSMDYSYVNQSTLTPSSFIKEAGIQDVTMENFRKRWDNFGNSSYSGGYNKKSSSYNTSPFDDGDNDDFFGYHPSKPAPTKKAEPEVIEEVKPVTNDITWHVGDIAIHTKFGEGKVLSVDGDNFIVVDFNEHGKKTLLGNHRSLSKKG